MKEDDLIGPATVGEQANNTEITLPDGIHLNVDWEKSELTIKMNGRSFDITSKSKRVVVGREPEANDT